MYEADSPAGLEKSKRNVRQTYLFLLISYYYYYYQFLPYLSSVLNSIMPVQLLHEMVQSGFGIQTKVIPGHYMWTSQVQP